MDKDAWQQLYKVEVLHTKVSEGGADKGFVYDYLKEEWQLKTHNGEVIATYRDRQYALKQARRKYKKLVRLMEKSLMS